MGRSDRISLLAAALMWGGAALAEGPAPAGVLPEGAPARVLSMNLCTDQLAMMLAAPGQVISLSHLAQDPMISPLHAQAARYPANHGGAEEIYLERPDLVLAGSFSDPAVVSMLRRLGVPVAQIDIVRRLDEVPARLAEVGALLHRKDRAQEVAARFTEDLAALSHPDTGLRAGFYYPNGYSLGTGTLAHDIVTSAGFAHIAAEMGRATSGRLPLELLVMAAPDLVIQSEEYPGASRSEEILHHPALRQLTRAGAGHDSGPDWVCGTPHVLSALRALAGTRDTMMAGPP